VSSVSFLARRLAALVLTMLAVSLLVFLLLEVNVDGVAVKVLGQFSTPDQRHLWLQQNGYFDPLPLRYARWLWGFIQGRWGVSTYYHADVRALIAPRLAASAVLMAASLALTVPLALTLGVLAGIRQGSPIDRLVSVVAILTTSVPEFASAVFLSAVFVFWLGWAPGVSTLADGFTVRELALPVAVLALSSTGYIARMTRASMVEVMAQPYVRTARLKGASTTRVVLAHALRNALGAPVTVILLQIPWLLSGVIVVEVFFAYPGFGTLLYVASVNSDIYLIEACAMIGVIAVVASQVVSDLINAALNPRLQQEGSPPTPTSRHPGRSEKRGEPGPSRSDLNAASQQLQVQRWLDPGQALRDFREDEKMAAAQGTMRANGKCAPASAP
jgi:peptide/nickel transport system permease protein